MYNNIITYIILPYKLVVLHNVFSCTLTLVNSASTPPIPKCLFSDTLKSLTPLIHSSLTIFFFIYMCSIILFCTVNFLKKLHDYEYFPHSFFILVNFTSDSSVPSPHYPTACLSPSAPSLPTLWVLLTYILLSPLKSILCQCSVSNFLTFPCTLCTQSNRIKTGPFI